MSLVAPREYRPSRTHALTTTAATGGGLLLIWYAPHLLVPRVLVIAGVIIAGITIATVIVMRRQRRILERLDKVDRQFAHVRMRYVTEEIDPRFRE